MLKSNFKDPTNVNVPLRLSLYLAFINFKNEKGLGTHASFFAYAISQDREQDGNLTYLRPLLIDGKPGTKAELLIQVGECVHHWDGKQFIAYDELETQAVLNHFQETS